MRSNRSAAWLWVIIFSQLFIAACGEPGQQVPPPPPQPLQAEQPPRLTRAEQEAVLLRELEDLGEKDLDRKAKVLAALRQLDRAKYDHAYREAATRANEERDQDRRKAALPGLVAELGAYYAKYPMNCADRGCLVESVTACDTHAHVRVKVPASVVKSATDLNGYFSGQVVSWAVPPALGWCDEPTHHWVIVEMVGPGGRTRFWRHACAEGSASFGDPHSRGAG